MVCIGRVFMRVCILLFKQLSMFELGSAMELFALPRDEFDDWYTTRVVSLDCQSRAGNAGIALSCEHVQHLPKCDLLVVPSYSPDEQPSTHNKNEILQHYANGGRIISFCSGSFLLAHLGLLDGRRAITHWRYAENFKRLFPHLNYQDNILYSYDGQIGCSAGSAAGIDLGIEVIRQDFGHECANAVARRLVLPAHRKGSQSQFVKKPISYRNSSLSDVLDWAVNNLSSALTIDQLSERANMTRRTFDRHFRKNYNMSPLEWLNERKLEVAKLLLEESQLSLDTIAEKAGYDNAITLRHNFKKYLCTTPTQYRDTFLQSA